MTVRRTILVVTGGTILLFWLLDSALDSFLHGHGSFAATLLRPAQHELWGRLLAIAIIAAGGAVWQRSAREVRRARDSLLRSEARHHGLVESSPESVVVHTREHVLHANARARAFFGLRPETERTASVFDFVHPDDHDAFADELARAAGGAPGRPRELRVVRPDGSVTDVQATCTTVADGDGTHHLTYFRDISEEVATRRDLIASRERLSLALDAARDGVWDWDLPSGRMVYNQAWASMLGLDLRHVPPDRSTWHRLVHPDDLPRVTELLEAHLRGDVPDFETEVRLRHAQGHHIWVLDRGRVVERDEQGRPVRMAGTHRDITARKEAQIALEVRNRLAENFLVARGNAVYDGALALLQEVTESPAGLFGTVDGAGNLRVVACHHQDGSRRRPLVRREELSGLVGQVLADERAVLRPGRTALDCCGHEVRGALAVPVTNRDVVLGVVVLGGRAASYGAADRALLESLAAYMAPILQSHLTSEASEAQLRQSQKMEALGVLAGGIAHDFNNILQAILGFTSLARQEAAEGSTLAGDLDRVLTATDRGRELVRRILLFSRREDQQIGPVEIGDVVRDAVDLLRPTIAANVRLHWEPSTEECVVAADAGQIGQVLLNLATNALHAMEDGGGNLVIRLELLRADARRDDVPARLRGADVVAIQVEDTGCGMDAAVLDRLFDPFFTTKEVGRGTGLGLSVVHGIVAAHGGDIRITSAPARGTCATVYLPRLARASAVGPGRVLLVESDTATAAVASSFLGREGHAVTVCSDVHDVRRRLAGGPQAYDVVVAGLTVPGGTGLDIAAAAGAAGGLPVILTAGAVEGAGAGDLVGARRARNIAAVVHKPLSTVVLARAVERVLAQRRPATAGAPDAPTSARSSSWPES